MIRDLLAYVPLTIYAAVVLGIVFGLAWLSDYNARQREAGDARRWEVNAHQMQRCERAGGVPILDQGQWMTGCVWPPKPCTVPVGLVGVGDR